MTEGGIVRIAICHSFYSAAQPSGENRVVEDQVAALRGAGHEVLLVQRDTDALDGKLYGLRTGINVALGSGFNPTQELQQFQPDVVHVHNLFPNFGIGWIGKWHGPVVVSLHNYRAMCSNGLFFRDGRVCTVCSNGGAIRAVQYGCYRGSRVATVPVALSRSRTQKEMLAGADAIITTSELSAEIVETFVLPGLPSIVIPNFGSGDREDAGRPSEPRTWIAVGRFSPEKGFKELVTDWPDSERLIVIGDGPEWDSIVFAARGKQIEVRSSVPRQSLRDQMLKSFSLVFPSRWYEADPQVVVEAMRVGLPVVSHYVNSVAPIVEKTGAGAVYGSNATLESALNRVIENRASMSAAAQVTFDSRWTKEAWLLKIENLYSNLITVEKTAF